MQHHLHAVIAEHLAHLARIGDRAQHRHQLDPGALGQLLQLLVHGVQRQFAEFIQHDLLRPAGQHLAAQLRADRAAGARDQHHPPLIAQRRLAEIGLGMFAAQEGLRRHRRQLVHQRLLADQLREGGQRLHLQLHLLQPPGDLRLFRLAQRRHRQQHPAGIAFLGDLGDARRRIDRQAQQRHALQRGVVVDKGDRVDAVMAFQRLRQLGAGGAGAIDQHPAARLRPAVDRHHHLVEHRARGHHEEEIADAEHHMGAQRQLQPGEDRQPGRDRDQRHRKNRGQPDGMALIGDQLDRRQAQPHRQRRGDGQHIGQHRQGAPQRLQRRHRQRLHGIGEQQRGGDQGQVDGEKDIGFLLTAQGTDEIKHSGRSPHNIY